jgi:hypothetical protein
MVDVKRSRSKRVWRICGYISAVAKITPGKARRQTATKVSPCCGATASGTATKAFSSSNSWKRRSSLFSQKIDIVVAAGTSRQTATAGSRMRQATSGTST